MTASRYQRISPLFDNTWVDHETGESFVSPGDTEASARFEAWRQAGGTPNVEPLVPHETAE